MRFIKQVISKLLRELYRFCSPCFWNKRLQINGIPRIYGKENLKLGFDVSLNENVVLQCSGGVTLGDRVTISRGVTILTSSLDTTDYLKNANRQYREHVTEHVKIGTGTWIASNVTICPGVEIAENCIVAAGSVVPKSLDKPGYLYGGVPAKPIKPLR